MSLHRRERFIASPWDQPKLVREIAIHVMAADMSEQLMRTGGEHFSADDEHMLHWAARALYGDPPIVLLDEPNAHLDATGEGQLIETLLALKERKAGVIIVAHRMGVLSAADKILVLRDGQIEAFGGRDEIVARLSGTAAPPIEAPSRSNNRKSGS